MSVVISIQVFNVELKPLDSGLVIFGPLQNFFEGQCLKINFGPYQHKYTSMHVHIQK